MKRTSQLRNIFQDLHLLAWLERRETDERTARAPEGIAQCAVTTRASLALHGEVQLVQIVRLQLQHIQSLVCLLPLRLLLCFESCRETACAVLAGSAPATGLGLTFWRYTFNPSARLGIWIG